MFVAFVTNHGLCLCLTNKQQEKETPTGIIVFM